MLQLGLIQGTSIRLHLLCANFFNVNDADTEALIKYEARAYLLYLVGCTLFNNKSGIRVFISYLRLFEDLDVVSTYAWGTATLAYLYRQLGYASKGGVKQIAGYFPLREILLVFHAYLKTHCEYIANT